LLLAALAGLAPPLFFPRRCRSLVLLLPLCPLALLRPSRRLLLLQRRRLLLWLPLPM
jgi:hypothetical protein